MHRRSAKKLNTLAMAAKITDTLETFTIRQIAEQWAKETKEQADLIERRLIEAATQDYSRDDILDHETTHVFVRLDAKNKNLSPEEMDTKVDRKEAELLADKPGLYVRDLQGDITAETAVSRSALLAWCKKVGIDPPRFLAGAPARPTAPAETRAREWLQAKVDAVEHGTEGRMAKRKYRERALEEISGLSRRAFERAWANTVPDNWKQPGRPGKSTHP